MANNRYPGLYGSVAKKTGAGVQQSLGGGTYFGYGSASQAGSQHFAAPAAQLPQNHGTNQQMHNMPRVPLKGTSQPEHVPSSQPSLLYGSQYASQSQPSFGHESQTLIVPNTQTPKRSEQTGRRNPTHWSQQKHSSLAQHLLSRAETASPLAGPQAAAKFHVDQIISTLETMTLRLNELSKPSDVEHHIRQLSDNVDKKLADFSASLDIPRRFTHLQNAVDALCSEQQTLAKDIQQHISKPQVTLCHVPTQVSPASAHPRLVAASVQVCSPMLIGRPTRVSAGTQMTPQYCAGDENRNPERRARYVAPEIIRDGRNTSTKHRSTTADKSLNPNSLMWKQLQKHTPDSTPMKDHRLEQEDLESDKASHGGSGMKLRSRGDGQGLGNITNKPQRHRTQRRESVVQHVVQEKVAPMQTYTRSKQKRSIQAANPTVTPTRKRHRTAATVDVRVAKTNVSCAPPQHAVNSPSHVQNYDDLKASPIIEDESIFPTPSKGPQHMPDVSMNTAPCETAANDAQRHQHEENATHEKGSEEQVSDSGLRTGGSIALVISGATVSLGSAQNPDDDCQDLYQQLVVGKCSREKAAGDEADSCPQQISQKAVNAKTQALHGVLEKAKAASRSGMKTALPPQPRTRTHGVEKEQRCAERAAPTAAQGTTKGHRRPERAHVKTAKALGTRQGSARAAAASVDASRAHATPKPSGRRRGPSKPPPTTNKRMSSSGRRPANNQRPSLTSSLFEKTPKKPNSKAAAQTPSDHNLARIIRERKRETAVMRRSGVIPMHNADPGSYMMFAQGIAEL